MITPLKTNLTQALKTNLSKVMFKNKLRTLRGRLLQAHSQLEIDSASDLQHCSISWLQFSTRTSSWVLSQETQRNRARSSTIVPRFWKGNTNHSITLEQQLALCTKLTATSKHSDGFTTSLTVGQVFTLRHKTVLFEQICHVGTVKYINIICLYHSLSLHIHVS